MPGAVLGAWAWPAGTAVPRKKDKAWWEGFSLSGCMSAVAMRASGIAGECVFRAGGATGS